ncbi:MAG: threonine synthase [Pseudomonadota bacterium]|nr:threonine synthase [Pseudomonadota bacterium]MDE3036834.1 threonine synthase [Pseudomonadota bacterium]
MRYLSTRGSAPALSFEDTVLAGLAPDGGLYVPETVPAFSMPEIAAMQAMSYPELAFTVISRFAGNIPPETLEAIIGESYGTHLRSSASQAGLFRHAAVAPLAQLDAHTFLLELFHGPTLAFKDFALQFLGRLLGYMLEKRGEKAVIVGATSGDTGSAAIEGCRGREGMEIVILHPYGRVSDVQRRQMTTVTDGNVHNIAIEGTFDDCQDIVKALFADAAFRDRHHLAAVNSINWARIVAQIPYYFYAALQLGAPAKAVSFSVPTGNFGDIYAGYMAKKMGLPVSQLIIAANRNDILARCLESGVYGMDKVTPTLSPSMDIQVSSNFERLLFDLHDRNGKTIDDRMARFRKEKQFTLSPSAWSRFKAEFSAGSVNDEDTKKTIADTYAASGVLLDPHSAVGLTAGQRCRRDTSAPLVALATAHPAKFPDAVMAATGVTPALPVHLQDLLRKKERFDTLKNDTVAVKKYIERSL